MSDEPTPEPETSREYQHAVSDTSFLLKKIERRIKTSEYTAFREWLIERGSQMFPDPPPSSVDESDKSE